MFSIDASHVLGVVALHRKGICAECVKGLDVSRMKGVDTEHIHAGLHAGYRHRAHAVKKQSSCRV